MAVHRYSPRARHLDAPRGGAAAAPPAEAFLADVLAGLRKPQKELPCKYFYDAEGSRLFDKICDLPEYYPTRTEMGIMHAHAPEMGERLGPGCQLIEYGSGSSLKTRLLLEHLPRPTTYVPVDISGAHLLKAAAKIARLFPELEVRPVAADFTQPFELPPTSLTVIRRAVYFPGSTIGNFTPPQATALLRGVADLCQSGGALLIGVDLKKDVGVLTAAYNDRDGVTAAFNKNLLARVNRELGADFDLGAFGHKAHYNAELGRVEMHLVSEANQCVRLAGNVIDFKRGETVHTENSHKYTPAEFGDLAGRCGFKRVQVWTDAAAAFSVQLFEVA